MCLFLTRLKIVRTKEIESTTSVLTYKLIRLIPNLV